ncbi:MAG: cytochrome C oxidase subunit IV family protein [Chloroflexi bacterium]|nr:cytochrome C oxidase subunit IV family protein [Chloroflexota bacterium]
MATQRPESGGSRPGLLSRFFWDSDHRYFQLPKTYAEEANPEGEGPLGTKPRPWAKKWWDFTGGDHPSPLFYVIVGLILGVITLLEYWLFTTDLEKVWINASLFALSSAKFFMVVAFFMHLKFDNKWFAKLFAAAFFLAIGIFLATLALADKLNG